jgi:hypothetical protein
MGKHLCAAQFGNDFRQFVNSALVRIPVVRGADAYSEWHKMLQSE